MASEYPNPGPTDGMIEPGVQRLDKRLPGWQRHQQPILPADETPAVLAAVQRYADAFDRRDVDALRRVWPTLTPTDYGKFKSSFSVASGIQLQVANEKVELGADGATAIVNADITRTYTPKGEKPLVSRDHTVFHLVKGNGAWVIKDLQ